MFRFTILLTLCWLPSLLLEWHNLDNFFAWRHHLIMYTGLLGLGYMSAAVLLAGRFAWVEKRLGGLDKSYKQHKYLGIAAITSLAVHWLTVQSGQWLVASGVLQRPRKGEGNRIVEGIPWRSISEQVGEIAFYALIVFIIISLVEAIGYAKFKLTHKLAGVITLAAVFHSVMLLKWDLGDIPMNVSVLLLSVIAVWCSILSLRGKIGQSKKREGTVVSVTPYAGLDGEPQAIRVSILLASNVDYREGQFAYLDFHDGEAPHPFSILSYDPELNRMDFGIKALGDYTSKLVHQLAVNQPVTVEGGYGHFQMSSAQQQIWVGAGIGIVPFIARLYWLTRWQDSDSSSNKLAKVHLFYCVQNRAEAYFETEIIQLLKKLNYVELHLLDASQQQFLSADQLTHLTQAEWLDVSFCGPSGFRKQLHQGLVAQGMPAHRFHYELFEMR
ncbi:ferredoxin reductase family protein [Vibrio hippocampi]|uniref:Flavohemoprotein n=1 Tax=Vibrio hippocampi TaxID=654686 RepID=A0ABM8ZKH3_9VIBR|nr:ferric reductase-like transmembrane domain-containing protein [Vibrio hippocampi]CAH0528758.1 Flavohemoprotein [Vibrio hippocampi]